MKIQSVIYKLHKTGLTSKISPWIPYPIRKIYINATMRSALRENDVKYFLSKIRPQNKIVVFLPYLDWNFIPQRFHHIARSFQKRGYFVLYGSRKIYDVFDGPFCRVGNSVLLYNIHPSRLLKFLTNKKNIILISYSPYFNWCVPKNKKNIWLKIFDLADHPSIHTATSGKKKILHDLSKLIKEADLVTTVSDSLISVAKGMGAKSTICVPNGVDFRFFVSTANKTFKPPDDLKLALARQKPLVFFHGFFGKWVDLDLIFNLAEKGKNYFTLILIGPDPENLLKEKIKKHTGYPENIFYLGEKNYKNIPSYLKYASAGIIPFDNSEVARHSSPMKILEYFSLGIPVVSTPLKGTVEGLIIAKDSEDFFKKIKNSISRKNAMADRLKEVVRKYSWERYVDAIERQLLELHS